MAKLSRGMGNRHLVIPGKGAIGKAGINLAEAHHAEGGAFRRPQRPHARCPEHCHACVEGEEEFLVPDGKNVEEHPVDDADRRWAMGAQHRNDVALPDRRMDQHLRVEGPHLADGEARTNENNLGHGVRGGGIWRAASARGPGEYEGKVQMPSSPGITTRTTATGNGGSCMSTTPTWGRSAAARRSKRS